MKKSMPIKNENDSMKWEWDQDYILSDWINISYILHVIFECLELRKYLKKEWFMKKKFKVFIIKYY